jgi:uncharacterized membrane protein YagU involved in acid resistance
MFKRKGFTRAVIVAGLIAGSLDITAALVKYIIDTHKEPTRVLQYIASAVFGPSAYQTKGMVILGLLFHYIVAFSFTLVFFLLYPKFKAASRNRLITGIFYGLLVWVIMNLLVVPQTSVKRGPFKINQVLIQMGILILAIGIPLSYLAYRYYRANTKYEIRNTK